MPLYEFACAACGARVEKIQKHSDPAPDPCPTCGKGPMVRQLSSPAIQFKGSGWYITDYAKKGSAAADSGSKAETSEKSDSTEKKADTAAAKSESSPAPAAAKPASES